MSDDRSSRSGVKEWPASGDEVLLRGPGRSDLSLDTTFDVLSKRRRRIVLSYLSRTGGVADVDDLVDRIVAWERELGETSPSHRQDVRLSLRHAHLPKLSAAGLVEVDDGAGTVEYRPTERVERLLSLVASEGPLP